MISIADLIRACAAAEKAGEDHVILELEPRKIQGRSVNLFGRFGPRCPIVLVLDNGNLVVRGPIKKIMKFIAEEWKVPNKPSAVSSDKQSTHGAPTPKWTPTSAGGGGSSGIPAGADGLRGTFKNTNPPTGGNK